MENIYSALILNSLGLTISEDAIQAIVTAAGGSPDASQIKVLVKADAAVMGHALVAEQRQWRGAPYCLDFFVHPNFYGEAGALLAEVQLPNDRKVQSYADAEAEGRCEALESAGFEREATLKRQIRRGDDWLDVYVYGR